MLNSKAIAPYWMAKRLQRLGMPMDAGALRQMPHGLIVRRYVGYDGTYAFDTASRDTGFVAEVQIICDSSVVIDALEVQLPWCTVDEWETEPCKGRDAVCAFPGERNRTFPAGRVLNYRILGRISKGTLLNGVLVGVGRGPIPAQEHGDSVRADLVFHTIGEDRLLAGLQVELRRVRQEHAVHKPATRRVPLFPPEDPGKTTLQVERNNREQRAISAWLQREQRGCTLAQADD